MNRYNNETVSSILKFITNFGDFYIPLFILVCIIIFVKNKYYFSIEAGGYLIAGIITYISKLLASRSRPLEALIKIPNSYSFPSGHTLTSIVFYTFLCYVATYNRKTRKILLPIVILLILAISISRIYLGVHYFSDVVGAIILSIPILLMNINIFNKHVKEKLL
jgi:undecaprenyl-diphosphatase